MTRARGTGAMAAAFLLAACAPATAQTGPPPGEGGERDRLYVYEVHPEQLQDAPREGAPTLEVSGSAEVRVPTDRAQVSFAVETEAATAREAVSANADRMDAVLRALRASGVQDLQIETHGYQLQPRYRRPDPRDQGGTVQIDGYRALNHVRVTVPDVQAVGRLLDAAVTAGANRVASLEFQASDTREARAQALREAVARARAEAEAIAGAMGVTLGPPLEVRGGAEQPIPFQRARMDMMEAAAATTPMEPGEQTVRASVSIKYRLGGAGR